MADDDEETMLRAVEMQAHLRTIMPPEQAGAATANALMMVLACAATGVPVEGIPARVEMFALAAFSGATMLKSRARGCKLTNHAKRKRLTGIVDLLRDAADRLEAVLLAEGKEKVR